MPERSARNIALVGPSGAGKTSLSEALLHASGAITRLGSVAAGTSTGDASPEARARGGSTELNLLHFDYLGDSFSLVDCPGAIGFAADGDVALAAADSAIVVIDPDPARVALAEPVLRQIAALGLPHMIFINKIDGARGSIQALLEALQPMSAKPLLARHIPIREAEKIIGFVDVALERAYHYRTGAPSEPIAIPLDLAAREKAARQQLLEALADHDDALMEAIVMDEEPSAALVLSDLTRETQEALAVPVLFGSALNGFGVRRLLKALRHDAPAAERRAERLGVTGMAALAFKVAHGPMGRLTYARLFGGTLKEGAELRTGDGQAVRAGTLFAVQGDKTVKLTEAAPGAVVAIAKVEGVAAGQWLGAGLLPPAPDMPPVIANAALAIATRDRKDDVRLSAALHKLVEEDRALSWEQDEALHETRIRGVNDEHLKITLDRLQRRFGVAVDARAPATGYKETIRKTVTQRGRHKKQSGGHGQFGDVVIEVMPLPRGEGFRFDDRITGGVVPKQYIPAVEAGVRDAMAKGPLGHPVVDVAVTLIDGSYHSVDSSEIAFRTAGRIAMSEALAAAVPHVLEPVMRVTVVCPAPATSRATSALSSRRGQILSLATREGWTGWDSVEAWVPQAELAGLDAELRSVSQGLATYTAAYDHLAELTGRAAEAVRPVNLVPA